MNKKARNTPPSTINAANAAARQVVQGNSPQQNVLVQEHSVTVQVQLPPPAMLQQYDAVRPGTSDLLIRWNEEEQAHRRNLETISVEANVLAQRQQSELASKQVQTQRDALMYQAETVRKSDLLGQQLGWVLCVAAGAAAIFLAMNGHDMVAVALAAIPTAAIVQSFRTLSRQDAREEARPAGSKPHK